MGLSNYSHKCLSGGTVFKSGIPFCSRSCSCQGNVLTLACDGLKFRVRGCFRARGVISAE